MTDQTHGNNASKACTIHDKYHHNDKYVTQKFLDFYRRTFFVLSISSFLVGMLGAFFVTTGALHITTFIIMIIGTIGLNLTFLVVGNKDGMKKQKERDLYEKKRQERKELT